MTRCVSPELLPCPCGSKDVGGANGIVSCYVCGMQTKKWPTTQIACDIWNHRAPVEAGESRAVAWRRPIDDNEFVYYSVEQTRGNFKALEPLFTHPSGAEALLREVSESPYQLPGTLGKRIDAFLKEGGK